MKELFPTSELIPNFIRLSKLPPRKAETPGKSRVAFASSVTAYHGHIPFLEAFEGYFKKGTFDPYDIAAIFAGTLTAYFVLILTDKRKG